MTLFSTGRFLTLTDKISKEISNKKLKNLKEKKKKLKILKNRRDKIPDSNNNNSRRSGQAEGKDRVTRLEDSQIIISRLNDLC